MWSANGLCLPVFLAGILLLAFDNVRGVERSTFIVHMDKSLMPKAFTSHHHWYSSTVDSLKSEPDLKDQGPSLLYAYDNALHGFSVVLSSDELETLKKAPGFVSAYADKKLTLDTTHTPRFLSLNSAYGLWPVSDYGKDVIIGVIDTGVWPESKSFSDDGMTGSIPARWKGMCEDGEMFPSSTCNSKLIGARYFNKGLRAANPEIKIHMNSARDTSGHGTHTASTAAGNLVVGASFFGYANGTARGIAPRARLAVYKVVWDDDGLESDLAAGIDQAVADGVDILSISVGSDTPRHLYEDALAIATFGAMEKGVLTASSAGNTGPDLGTTAKGIPWALIVAGGTVDRNFAGTLTLGNGVIMVGWTMFPTNAYVEDVPLVYNKTLSACNSSVLLAEAPSSIIICDYTGRISEQLYYIATSTVRGAVFIDDEPEVSLLNDPFPCAGVVIKQKAAATVIKYAKQGGNEATATMEFHQTFVGAKPAPAAGSYSSRGPSPTFPSILKPDIMAPGSRILAAWVPDLPAAIIGHNWYLTSDYKILHGTSMACPHVSGAAAMLKGAHPKWSPAAIRSALMTTANPLDNTLKPIRDEGRNFSLASPLVIGAGHMDPNQALDPGLIYDATPEDYVNLFCSMNFTAKQILTITRSRGYNCSNAAPDLNYPSFIALYSNETGPAKLVQKFKRTVTNVGSGAATYNVKVVPPRHSRVTVWPKTLEFGSKHEKQSYTVTISYKRSKKGKVTFGSITWLETYGKRTVRSPIVVSPVVAMAS